MSSSASALAKFRAEAGAAERLAFQRGERDLQIKKSRRRVTLRFKHVLLLLLLQGGLFYSLHKAYLFIISWDKLNIKEIRIVCPKEDLRRNIERYFANKSLGNILLCDILLWQKQTQRFAWVQNARIQKVFPSSLEIEITPRRPAACLKKGQAYLIDQAGVMLQKVESPEATNLPLLTDEADFRQDYPGKLAAAWQCLDGLSPRDRMDVQELDLSSPQDPVLRLRNDETRILLTTENFAGNVEYYKENKTLLESRLGALEYVNLRFEDRIYVKTREIKTEAPDLNTAKEAE
ncbi:MAG TPA: cell division protein FtsQ/DivIB [Candidatus Aminicenantes bacterium]|nr:cell division protein FtsQ/DivIB [Acidobacteriota bacterium]HOI45168.1 cell division protein FtsQ/DivIB [Candidatus Aminicenantes bacterium]